jgi:hypothetical protein
LGGIWRSPGFETNDLGFLRNADRGMGYTWIAYREWNPRWIFRNYQINFNLWSGWNFAGERLYTGGNINGGGRLKNYWRFWIGINREGAELRDSELRGGPMMAFPGAWNSWFNINTDDRKIFRFRVNGFNSFKDDKITRQMIRLPGSISYCWILPGGRIMRWLCLLNRSSNIIKIICNTWKR